MKMKDESVQIKHPWTIIDDDIKSKRKRNRSYSCSMNLFYTIKSQDEGLTQTSTCPLINKYPSFYRTVMMHLPLFLTLDVWQRHQYSLNDIQTTLDYFPPKYLWKLALLFNLCTSNSAIKIAFCAPDAMVYGSKAIVIRKLLKIFKANYEFHKNKNILDMTRVEHIPPLPHHIITYQTYLEILSYLPKNHEDLNLLKPVLVYGKYRWKDIFLAPLGVEHGALYCCRLIRRDIFDKSGKNVRSSMCCRPYIIQVDKDPTKYYGVYEEACFFSYESPEDVYKKKKKKIK